MGKAVGFEHPQQSISKMVDKCRQAIALCNFAGKFATKSDSNLDIPERWSAAGIIVRFTEASQANHLEVIIVK